MRRDANNLIIKVEDNGRAKSKSPPEKGHGIGLTNVRDRLAGRFGAAARLETEVSEDGFAGTLTLPLDTHND